MDCSQSARTSAVSDYIVESKNSVSIQLLYNLMKCANILFNLKQCMNTMTGFKPEFKNLPKEWLISYTSNISATLKSESGS